MSLIPPTYTYTYTYTLTYTYTFLFLYFKTRNRYYISINYSVIKTKKVTLLLLFNCLIIIIRATLPAADQLLFVVFHPISILLRRFRRFRRLGIYKRYRRRERERENIYSFSICSCSFRLE